MRGNRNLKFGLPRPIGNLKTLLWHEHPRRECNAAVRRLAIIDRQQQRMPKQATEPAEVELARCRLMRSAHTFSLLLPAS